jgi:hypothetical protein
VQAQIKISNTPSARFTLAVFVLACLLSGFFWLGYWVSETDAAPSAETVLQQRVAPQHRSAPAKTPLSPVELLKINPEDSVRL